MTTERELQHLAWLNARTDYLTGMFNRRYFYEYLSEHEENAPFTFIMIDLDNFKEINDSGGHDMGDKILLISAKTMNEAYPDCPIVRWGGDEFIVVVPNDKTALATTEHFQEMLEVLKTRSREVTSTPLAASAGIATGATPENVDAIIKVADEALYRAKATGKSCAMIA